MSDKPTTMEAAWAGILIGVAAAVLSVAAAVGLGLLARALRLLFGVFRWAAGF